jgi:short-subunit dehydrogenase
MDLGLRGRRALVTGASKGIGLACAEALAAEGCDLALVARTAADLQAAGARIRAASNVAVAARALDLGESGNVDALAAEFPDIDILVNNAGAIPGGSLDQVEEARWRAAWDLKVFGYVNMCRRFYALMRGRGRGVIVNVIGAAGESPTPTTSPAPRATPRSWPSPGRSAAPRRRTGCAWSASTPAPS